jgi:chemotaxis protein MotA
MLKAPHPALQPYWRPPILGAAFGVVLVLGSILLATRSLLAFLSIGGLLIVVGGVIAVAYMSYDESDVHRALIAIRTMLDEPDQTDELLHRNMTDIIEWARLFREKGLLALEQAVARQRVEDPFLRYGLNMVLGEYAPDEVRSMMETAADATYERDGVPADILHAMASHAPAFGMVGTLIGMVAMLANLDAAIANIGSSLAVSFLSTLYGVISARMVYLPAAAKIEKELTIKRFRHMLMTEGMVMLAAAKAPLAIQDRLNSFLRPEDRDYFNIIGHKTPARPPLRAVAL